MDMHPGEDIVFEGRPLWRGLLSFYVTAVTGAVAVAVGEFRFVGIAAPDRVVAAVDRARREAAERAAEPRFVSGPRTARNG